MSLERLSQLVLASLMAALTGIGAYIYVPLGPVPIVLANLFVFLAGLLLGSRWALVSMGLYLLLGAMGIPVFSGGRGGLAHFVGPTGGYLVGYALAAWIIGWISGKSRGNVILEGIAVLAGGLSIYGLGVPWLKMGAHLSWSKALVVGFVPFIFGDLVKGCAAIAVAHAIRPSLRRGGLLAE